MIFGEVDHGNESLAAKQGVIDGAVEEDVLLLRLHHVDALLAQIIHHAKNVHVTSLNGLRKRKSKCAFNYHGRSA